MNSLKAYWFTLGILILALNACGTQAPASPPAPTVVPPSTNTPFPTLSPTETATQTSIPAPTATPIPHPLDITGMRSRQYPGSVIVIEDVLDPGVGYNRYYVSYLSEGLKIYALMTVPVGNKPPT
jgi:hypothetical protein